MIAKRVMLYKFLYSEHFSLDRKWVWGEEMIPYMINDT